MDAENFFRFPQYSLESGQKQELVFQSLQALHAHHLKHSGAYHQLVSSLFQKPIHTLSDLPYLPVSIFKNHDLKSIPDEQVFKTLLSSGTTGSTPSKIFLDKETAQLQTKALSNILQYVLGKERLPMLVIDTIGLIKDRTSFSARGAGVLGMSVFGKSHQYLLNEQMEVDLEGLRHFLQKHSGAPLLLFGFTFMVWQFLYEAVPQADLSNATLIHSGGWKKLAEKSVDNATFKKRLHDKFGISRIFNFYGMVEQVGSVFLECEQGYLHTPNFAEVIIPNPYDFSVCSPKQEGIIQVLSILPGSYPGFSLLTEDRGIICGEDNCTCGRKGTYFSILGRMKKAELRGCSDTFTLQN
jgi:phenylacetate-coenzyme A ligase PaaK-like adenylate-forming protein